MDPHAGSVPCSEPGARVLFFGTATQQTLWGGTWVTDPVPNIPPVERIL